MLSFSCCPVTTLTGVSADKSKNQFAANLLLKMLFLHGLAFFHNNGSSMESITFLLFCHLNLLENNGKIKKFRFPSFPAE